LFPGVSVITLYRITSQKNHQPHYKKKPHIHAAKNAILVPMNLKSPGPWPISSVNGRFSRPASVNVILILVFNHCHQKTYYYEGFDREKNHQMDPYYRQHTDNWLHLWSGQKFSSCSSRYSMGALPTHCIVGALVMERPLGKKVGTQKIPRSSRNDELIV
jgi:hypothetical protein